MNFKKTSSLLALAAAMSLGSVAANATPIVGTFDMSSIRGGGIYVTSGEIDWTLPLNPGVNAVATYGEFVIDGTPTGSFAALPILNPDGYVQDMSVNSADANYVPLGASITPKYIKLAAEPNWLFTLTFLSPGTDVDGAGPLPQAPYTLEQTSTGVTASFSVKGSVCDAGVDGVCDSSDDVTFWTGLFTTQFVESDEDTVAELVNKLTTVGYVDTSWSGSITAMVPEPGSLALLGLGLMGLGCLRRRKEA